MKLNAENVHAVARDCLFDDDEDLSTAVKVEGVLHNFGFHPQRLEQHRADVHSMLDELPVTFRANVGDSFLNGCMTDSGEQWTHEHATMELLFALGLALRMVHQSLPCYHPTGVPYYAIEASA